MNQELKNFLKHHKIHSADIIDADGQRIAELRDHMKENDILFAYNTTPCEKAGHTIRDRSGHCIACNTANIAFMKRTKQSGFIYIAGSILKNYIKVGMTTENPTTRMHKLNSRKVGGTNDWNVIKAIKCDYAQQVEFDIHKLLEKYLEYGQYYDNNTKESTEIFRCSFNKANEIVEKYFKDNKINKKEVKKYIANPKDYNRFKNLLATKKR